MEFISYLFVFLCAMLIILLFLSLYSRVQLKQSIKKHPRLYSKVYDKDFANFLNIVQFLNFLYRKKNWQDIDDKEILACLKKQRFIDFLYYAVFLTTIVMFIALIILINH